MVKKEPMLEQLHLMVNSNNSNANTLNSGGLSVTVAGISSNTKDLINELTKGVNTKNKVRVNLAWAILLTPLLAIAIIGRKLYFRKRV